MAMVCLLQLSAAAQQPLIERVRWRAPAGCPTRVDIEQRLERVDSAAWLELDGAIQRAGQGYRLRLRVRGQGRSFERVLRAETCDVLAESTVWLVELAATQLSAAGPAVAIAPEGSARGSEAARSGAAPAGGAEGAARGADAGSATVGSARAGGSESAARGADALPAGFAPAGSPLAGDGGDQSELVGAGVDEAPAADALADGEADAPANADDTSYLSAGPPQTTHDDAVGARAAAASGEDDAHGLHFRLGLGAAATDVGLSGLSPHLALDLTLAFSHWSLGARLGALLHTELDIAGGARVDLQTYAAQLLGCRLWDAAGLSLGPCLTLSALHTAARTTGLTSADSSSAGWLAAGPSIVLHARLTSAVRLSGELGAWATLTPRPSFEVSGTTVARAGTLAGYARLGASYELW